MENKALTDSEEAEEPGLRMVLVGRTGSGRSASGNTILGRKVFKSQFSASSVTSECQKETEEIRGQILSVVDTPDLFDTFKHEEVNIEIFKCISFVAPGPHVVLVVIQPGRFTKEEEAIVQLIEKLFGKNASDYTMALFTHGDDLEEEEVSVEDFISKNPSLSNFIQQCGGRYHIFNNRSKDPSQVNELLEKIRRMNHLNGESYYTSEILKEVEEAIREKMKELMRKNPQMKPEEARRISEKDNKFIQFFVEPSKIAAAVVRSALVAGIAVVGFGVEVLIGAGVGSVGGPVRFIVVGAGARVDVEVPVGAGVGSVGGPVGSAVGAAVGLAAAGLAVAIKRRLVLFNNQLQHCKALLK